MLALWIILGLIGFIIWIILIIFGIKFCLKNNAIGIFLLFIALNIFGLVLGWTILWNNKIIEEGNYNKNYFPLIKEEYKKNKDFKKKLKEQKTKEIAEKYRKMRIKNAVHNNKK